jgi:zinc-ribbon domain
LAYPCYRKESPGQNRQQESNDKEIIVAICSKCGAELSPSIQFCTACGAPVAAAAAVAAPAQPAAATAKQGSSALKIILIIVAVFVGLGIIGAGAVGFMAWRVAHAFHVSGSGNNVTLSTPGGTLTANSNMTFSASDLGTDIYPGAQPGKGGGRLSLAGNSVVTATFVTSDSKDQVVSFYKDKLGSEANVFDYPAAATISLNKSKNESVLITVEPNSSQYNGKTLISIVHTTSTNAQ